MRLFLAALLPLPDVRSSSVACRMKSAARGSARRAATAGMVGTTARERRPLLRPDDDGVAGPGPVSDGIEQKRLRAAHGAKTHRHVRSAVRVLHESPYRRSARASHLQGHPVGNDLRAAVARGAERVDRAVDRRKRVDEPCVIERGPQPLQNGREIRVRERTAFRAG